MYDGKFNYTRQFRGFDFKGSRGEDERIGRMERKGKGEKSAFSIQQREHTGEEN